jgi:hypothetical protein
MGRGERERETKERTRSALELLLDFRQLEKVEGGEGEEGEEGEGVDGTGGLWSGGGGGKRQMDRVRAQTFRGTRSGEGADVDAMAATRAGCMYVCMYICMSTCRSIYVYIYIYIACVLIFFFRCMYMYELCERAWKQRYIYTCIFCIINICVYIM